MSFSADAKAELCSGRIEKRSLAVAECYGILLYCNTFHANEIRIITASPDFSVRLPRLFWKAFSLNFDVLPPEDALGKRSFCITDRAKIGRILEAFGAETGGPVAHHINLSVLEEPGCAEAFVRGAFLAGGSVTDPEKRFHLASAASCVPACWRWIWTRARQAAAPTHCCTLKSLTRSRTFSRTSAPT